MKKRKSKGKSLNERYAAKAATHRTLPEPTTFDELPAGIPADPALPHVAAFCEKLVPDKKPVKLTPTPRHDSRETNECVLHVEKHIADHGGEPVYGWAIWEIPEVLIEGEFHAVWRAQDGKLVDVTPLAAKATTRTFLQDPTLRWEGFQINNIRRPLVSDTRVSEYIAAHEAHFRMLSRGARRTQFGAIHIDRSESDPVFERMFKARQQVLNMLEEQRSGGAQHSEEAATSVDKP